MLIGEVVFWPRVVTHRHDGVYLVRSVETLDTAHVMGNGISSEY